MRNPALFIADSDLGGRGVFTGVPIMKDDAIEICPIILMKKGEMAVLDKTTLYDYYFLWGDEQEQCVIALGYGSLYNHFAPSNADYGWILTAKRLRFLPYATLRWVKKLQ